MIRISFIVPVYKVEDYLDDCISSIVNQDFDNSEIILVDDGSPDKCPEICDVWAEKDSRIKVIHKTNGGLSDARNTGLNYADGDYVWFVDSDDFLKPNAAEVILRVMSRYPDVDVYSTSLTYYKNGYYIKDDFSPKHIGPISGYDYVNKKYLTGAIQRFIIKRTLLIEKAISFFSGVIHEDGPFGYMLMYYAQSVVCLPQAVYCYRQRDNSIMSSLTLKTSYDSVKNHKRLMRFCDKCVLEDKKTWFRIICSDILVASYSFVSHLYKTPEFRGFEEENKKYVRTELLKILPKCGIRKKLFFISFLMFPKMIIRITNSKMFVCIHKMIRGLI